MTPFTLSIATTDGTCPATLFGADLPAGSPGVILYMDIFGPRASLFSMASRLAENGYVTLVPDLFYRQGAYGPFDAATAFSDPDTSQTLRALMGATTQAMTAADTAPFTAALAERGCRKIGTTGYCMGGAHALTAAASSPLIHAAASFHGGNLASDAPDSPHLLAARMNAQLYIGTAGEDRSFPPEQSARLAQSLREAGLDHIIENYPGCAHGWCVPDHSVYDAQGAERHWTRLLTLYSEALA